MDDVNIQTKKRGEAIDPSNILLPYDALLSESLIQHNQNDSLPVMTTTTTTTTTTLAFRHNDIVMPNRGRNLDLDEGKDNHNYSGHDSPFFRPSTPLPLTVTETVSTPNGTHVLQTKKRQVLLRSKASRKTDMPEKKSTIMGAASNLTVNIIGAGIIGIPYAMKQTGILAGLCLIIAVAVLTDKSLRLLIETGKHAHVQSYEMLMEVVFGGRMGFVFISVNMFIMSFGAMICYLLIIKDTFASIVMGNQVIMDTIANFGLSIDDLDKDYVGRCILIVSSLVIILPLSMQRDMDNLTTTSTISVIFDILMVVIVALCSPVQTACEQSGGILNVMKSSTIHYSTFFIGLGVLSFAFVCQDSSFIIAGSLERPTKKRWAKVTKSSLSLCAVLAIVIGVTGFLGFQESTRGNVLENFLVISRSDIWFASIHTYQAINMARIFLGLTMFCVYPLASYVARHVLIVLFFSGKAAHTGDDHSVLARWDRRFALTFVLYVSALVPACLFDNLGIVLSLTGAVAGSSLSYVGPGLAYLSIHGATFLRKTHEMWNVDDKQKRFFWMYNQSIASIENAASCSHHILEIPNQKQCHWVIFLFRLTTWYCLLMPIWCSIAMYGNTNFETFQAKDSVTSGKCETVNSSRNTTSTKREQYLLSRSSSLEYEVESDLLLESTGMITMPGRLMAPSQKMYGSLNESEDAKQQGQASIDKDQDSKEKVIPTASDFLLAALYILFGAVALVAGVLSITTQEKS